MNNFTVIIRPIQEKEFHTCHVTVGNYTMDLHPHMSFKEICALKALEKLWTVPDNMSGFKQFYALGYELVGIFDGHIDNHNK